MNIDTEQHYIEHVARMAIMMIRVYKDPKKLDLNILFSEEQETALLQIIQTLERTSIDKEILQNHLILLMKSLFFTRHHDIEHRSNDEPMNYFLMCLSLGRNGAFLVPASITSRFAAILYGLRLSALDMINHQAKESQISCFE